MKRYMLLICAVLWMSADGYAVDLDDYLQKFQIHGFISQGYLKSDKNDFYFAETEDGTFHYNETGINFATQVTDQIRMGIQFLSRDLGRIGNNDIEIDWAFADYRYRNWLGLRVGKIKKPFGLYNRVRDIDSARTFVMLPTMIYDEVPRETYSTTTGIGIYGYLPYGFYYEFQYGMVDIDKEGGTAKNVSWFTGLQVIDIDGEDTSTTYLEWETPLQGLKFAGTVFFFPDTTYYTPIGELFSETINYVVSAEYAYDRLVLASEYRLMDFDLNLTLNDTTLVDQTLEACYISASYQFTDRFTLGAYYGELYTDKDDRDGDRYKAANLPSGLAWRKDLALTTKFDINDYWTIKLEAHLMDGLAQVTTPAAEAEDNWSLFAAKMTFSF